MKLSVNLNKIALLRNARGENYPDLHYFANKAIDLGVDGLTLHPRPDHRHATSNDVISLAGHSYFSLKSMASSTSCQYTKSFPNEYRSG